MQSKISTLFKPILGFVRSQTHSFVFSALIFTVAMVSISFAIGSNPLFGYDIRPISYGDGNTITFACVVVLSAVVFAAYSFRPFTAKNESDTFLSLPISKFSLLTSQMVFGLVCIAISALLSFAVFFPAMNIDKFSEPIQFINAIKSIFTEIVLPMYFYYLLAVALMIKTRNFISTALIIAAECIVSFFSGSYICNYIGLNALGVDYFAINPSSQTFFYDSGIFMPTRFITTLIRSLTGLDFTTISYDMFAVIVNILLCIGLFIFFALSVKKVNLGEMRPFAIKPALKILLPVLIIVAISISLGFLPSYLLFVTIFGAIAVAFIIALQIKNLKKAIVPVVTCIICALIPFGSTLLDGGITKLITYDVPSASKVEKVYFDVITVEDSATPYIFRVCYTEEESIKKVVSLHQSIVNNIKTNDLINTSINNDTLSLDEGYVYYSGDLLIDQYADFRSSSDPDIYEEQWGLGDGTNVNDDYWLYIFDYDSESEISILKSLPISGTDEFSYSDIDTYPEYYAAFYYQLKDGSWHKRLYTPLPASWIRNQSADILDTPETRTAMISLFKESNYGEAQTIYLYGNNINLELVLETPTEQADFMLKYLTERARYGNSGELVYTYYDMYIYDTYTETLEYINSNATEVQYDY